MIIIFVYLFIRVWVWNQKENLSLLQFPLDDMNASVVWISIVVVITMRQWLHVQGGRPNRHINIQSLLRLTLLCLWHSPWTELHSNGRTGSLGYY